MIHEFEVKQRYVGHGHPLYFIAEAGVNHNGDLDMALALVDAAAEAGADAVKFQTFRAESIITPTAPKAQYHIDTTGSDEEQTWFELLKTQELTESMHVALVERCAQRDICFLSTPYDIESVDLLDRLGVPLYKVASTDANNHPLLTHIAKKGRPVILSTAMCSLGEVHASVNVLRDNGMDQIIVMQCTGSYPAPVGQANLRAMDAIAQRCDVLVGYSDHVTGNSAALAAVALGACAYEKHFTLDRNLPGPDHRASMEPAELTGLVQQVREVELAMGDGRKRVMPCELANRQILRKSILAGRLIRAGEVLSKENLVIRRAGGRGLSPDKFSMIEGRQTTIDIDENDIVDEEFLA